MKSKNAMFLKSKYIITTGLFLISLYGLAQTNMYEYKLREVKPKIFVTIRPEPLRQAVEGNFVFIINDSDVVVVDAGGSPQAARIAIRDLKKITSLPVSHLINTHFHGDHTFGNQEYKNQFKEIEIVSSVQTAEVMMARVGTFKYLLLDDAYFKKMQKQADSTIHQLNKTDSIGNKRIVQNFIRFRDFDLFQRRECHSELKITPPTLVFDKEMVLYRKDREIRIFNPGSGDTPGDTWVFLPKEKILITGDAVVYPIPYGFSKDPVEWAKTLEKVVAMDFDIMITGHGEVQYGKAYMLQLMELLNTMIEQVKILAAESKTEDEIRKLIDITAIEKKFTQNDPFLSFYFDDYFKQPMMQTLINHFLSKK